MAVRDIQKLRDNLPDVFGEKQIPSILDEGLMISFSFATPVSGVHGAFESHTDLAMTHVEHCIFSRWELIGLDVNNEPFEFIQDFDPNIRLPLLPDWHDIVGQLLQNVEENDRYGIFGILQNRDGATANPILGTWGVSHGPHGTVIRGGLTTARSGRTSLASTMPESVK